MSAKTIRRLVMSVIAAALAGNVLLWGSEQVQRSDPIVGTWTLNLSRSTFSPGPPPDSTIVAFSRTGSRLSAAIDFVRGPLVLHWTYSGMADGKDYPASGNLDTDAVTIAQIDAKTIQVAYKREGKVLQINRHAVSADGKTMVVTSTGVNARGLEVHNVAVYDKTG
jgi:hypothetical protein